MEHLKGKGDGLKPKPDAATPKAWLFETGTNQWRRFDSWPPKNAAARELLFRRRRASCPSIGRAAKPASTNT